MNLKRLVIAVASLGLAPLAIAQTTILDYQGSPMTGTYSTNNSPALPFSGAHTASFTFTGSIAQDNLTLTSYALGGTGTVGIPAFSWAGDATSTNEKDFQPLAGNPEANLSLTESNGKVTGATFEEDGLLHASPDFSYSIGSGGDSISYSVFDFSTLTGSYISASNSTAGTWKVAGAAPEIDPTTAASELALLAGAIAVIRGRRRYS